MAIYNGYCTLAQIKAALRIDDSVDDSLLELAVETASRQIDNHCERVFYNQTTSRIFTPLDSYLVLTDDIASISSVKTSSAANGTFDVTWKSTDYQLEPLNGRVGGNPWPYTQIRAVGDYTWPLAGQEATVQITATWGYYTTPTDIKQACVLLASRIFKRNDSPLGITGFGDLGVIRVSRIDPDIEAILAPYKKVTAV